jgi:hypothetical protein
MKSYGWLIRSTIYLACLLAMLFCCAEQGNAQLANLNGPVPQFFSASGVPLVGGKLYSYAAGTSTPLATYSDAAGTVLNANPLVLNAGGFPANASGIVPIFLRAQAYKLVLKDALGVQLWAVDNLTTLAPLGMPFLSNTLANRPTSCVASITFFVQTDSPYTLVQCNSTGNGWNAVSPTWLPATIGTIGQQLTVNSGATATTWQSKPVIDVRDYTDINAAITAASAGNVVYLPEGLYQPTSTISITKALTFECASSGATIIRPTNAVTGAAIAVNPAVAAQVIVRGCFIDMANVPGIPALTVNNLAANSELGYLVINKGTIGIDITNTSVSMFHDLYITNQSSFNIRDNGDGGAEHTYNDVWLINYDPAVATTTALFKYVRTTTTDTGGLYMFNVRAIQNGAGGVVTNGFLFTSSAGTPTIAHANMFNTVCDGVTGGDCTKFNNVSRMTVVGGQWGNAKANQTCAAGTADCYAGVNIIASNQLLLAGITLVSNNRDISVSGAVDNLHVASGTRLYGSAAAGAAHIWVVTGAALTNAKIWDADYDTTTVWSNNAAALIAAASLYSNAGAITTSGNLTVGGNVSIPNSFFYGGKNVGGAALAMMQWDGSATANLQLGTQAGGSLIFYSDQFLTELARFTSGSKLQFSGDASATLYRSAASTVKTDGSFSAPQFLTNTNCSSTASPAVCAAASAGSVAIANPGTAITVNTTAVTANSQILITEDSSLGAKLGVTCNATLGRTFMVTARTAATSFTITASATPAANSACLSYVILN